MLNDRTPSSIGCKKLSKCCSGRLSGRFCSSVKSEPAKDALAIRAASSGGLQFGSVSAVCRTRCHRETILEQLLHPCSKCSFISSFLMVRTTCLTKSIHSPSRKCFIRFSITFLKRSTSLLVVALGALVLGNVSQPVFED